MAGKAPTGHRGEHWQVTPGRLFERFHAFTSERIEADLAALPDARETIGGISVLRCVASSTPSERLRWKLRHAGLIDLFQPHVFSSDMVRNGKPAPDLFLYTAASMGVSPVECLVVEDSANGVLAGKAASMQVVCFTGGRHCMDGHADALISCGADVIVESFAGLRGAIERLSPPPS